MGWRPRYPRHRSLLLHCFRRFAAKLILHAYSTKKTKKIKQKYNKPIRDKSQSAKSIKNEKHEERKIVEIRYDKTFKTSVIKV